MTRPAQQHPETTTPALCEVRAIHRVSSEPPAPSAEVLVEAVVDVEDHTLRMVVGESEDLTSVDSVEVFRAPGTDYVEMSNDSMALLRERLREAEAREDAVGSGIRVRPTPPEGVRAAESASVPVAEVDPLEELDVEVETPRTFDEWTESICELPEVEISLAPNSENNFYGGFDDEHPDGLFLATYQDLTVGTPVYAIVHLPGGCRFRTPALVEFTRGQDAVACDVSPGVGLRMCGLDARMRGLIRAFIAHRPPMFYVD